MKKLVRNILKMGAGNPFPFKSDLQQRLFKDNTPFTPDGLYAKDYSGSNNHAPIKNSYMVKMKSGTAALMALNTQLAFVGSDNWSFESWFVMDSSTTNQVWCFMGDARTTGYTSAKIYFRSGIGIYVYSDQNTSVNFTNYTDYKTLRKYKIHLHDNLCDLYVNDALISSKAFTYTSFTAQHLVGARGFTCQNGGFFDVKVVLNGTLIRHWPCQEGYSQIYDVINSSVLSIQPVNYEGPGRQDVSHYNIIHGCDLWTNHNSTQVYVPKKADGTSFEAPVDIRYWNIFLSTTMPFPVCESTIQTLQGDFTYWTLKANFNNKIFSNITPDKTFKDVLVYGTAKNTTDAKKITNYLKYNTFEACTYNDTLLATLAATIRSGNAKYITVGDSLSPITLFLNEQFRYYCSTNGLGFSVFGMGNYPQNNYADIWVSYTGSPVGHTNDNSDVELWGLNGVSFTMPSGSTMDVDVRGKLYTNLRVFYAQNTNKGTFDVAITGGSTYSVNASGTKGLGVWSQNLTESSKDFKIQNFSGEVIIYGFELNNSGVINNLMSHGGFTTSTFNSTINPSYLSAYCSVTALQFGIIMLGANDATIPQTNAIVKTNTLQIISDMRANNASLPIILFTPTTRAISYPNPGEDLTYWNVCRSYLDTYKQICDEQTNVCIIDTGLLMPRYDVALAAGYMADGIHPTILGKEFLARQILKAVLNK